MIDAAALRGHAKSRQLPAVRYESYKISGICRY
jgi:hypothetical protein